jgi:uncharacterized membrane protein
VVIVVIGVFTLSQAVFGDQVVEAFSELAVLGPDMKIGDYPREVLVGEAFRLYLYVGNHEGKTMYYSVKVKLGDQFTSINETTAMEAPVIAGYQRVLMTGENWTRPVTLSIDEAGTGRRLVFELWVYDEALERFHYHGRWNQLWMNITQRDAV